ncbi:hypothetical protein BANT10_03301 [Brevibacterium antiquum]|uniref:Uncharacterized protein n=2 Tax=Brevibacterium antiquum TaxID=234835 RepID=A0A2H1KPU8_9MICO|nr:hypothetical protein BANT10_03301 [Brevibacterium antiquum]
MSQALRIDPTMIETYSAMLFIDRSELFGADTPNNAFVPLEAAGQAVPISEKIGADVSDRFNVDFYVDGQPIGGFEFNDAHQEEWWKKVHEVGELTVVSCRDTNTLVHAPTWGQGMEALIADEAKIVRMPLVVRAYENGVGTSAPGQ